MISISFLIPNVYKLSQVCGLRPQEKFKSISADKVTALHTFYSQNLFETKENYVGAKGITVLEEP